jgi:FkbM family methyltransferase
MKRQYLNYAYAAVVGAVFSFAPLYFILISSTCETSRPHFVKQVEPIPPAFAQETPPMSTAPSSPAKVSAACRLLKLLSTEFSQSHNHLAGDPACSAPYVEHDNQHLHPKVASLCSTKFPPHRPFKLLKHPKNIDYVESSRQENGVSSAYLPVAATCRSSPGLIIDMGTNEGAYAMATASLGCTVLTFDPQSLCIDIFKRSLLTFPENAAWVGRVFALNAAATTTASTMEASIDSCEGCYMTDGLSISCGGNQKFPGNWQRKKVIDGLNVGAAIEALGFNETLLLHIDTEGHEIGVLRGLQANLLSKSIKNIIIELRPMIWNFDDDAWLRGVLQQSGYQCVSLFNGLEPQNTNKPPVDLSKPLPEIDMLCSMLLSEYDFSNTDRMLSCLDTAI